MVTDFIVIVLRVMTGALMPVIAAAINVNGHLAIFAVLAWGILPIGGALCGIVAAFGYGIGVRIVRRRPGSLALAAAPITNALAYIAIFYIEYRMINVRGVPLSNAMSFGNVFDAVLRSTTIGVGGIRVTGALGAIG